MRDKEDSRCDRSRCQRCSDSSCLCFLLEEELGWVLHCINAQNTHSIYVGIGVFLHSLSPIPARWEQQSWCCSTLQLPQQPGDGSKPFRAGVQLTGCTGFCCKIHYGRICMEFRALGFTLVFNYPDISSLPMSVFHISFKSLGV